MEIDGKTSKREFSTIKPEPGSYILFEAQLNCFT